MMAVPFVWRCENERATHCQSHIDISTLQAGDTRTRGVHRVQSGS